jgi:hypothetical protein
MCFRWENSWLIKLFNSFFINEEDSLILYRQYNRTQGYGSVERVRKTDFNFMLKNYKNNDFDYLPFLISKYNGKHYPFFDIDNHNDYNHFCSNAKNYNYVVFQSSPSHYWIFVDDEFTSFDTFKEKPIYDFWSVYCDKNYQDLSLNKKMFFVRSTYKNLDREPKLIYKNGDFTTHFKVMVEKIEKFFVNESLEMSILRYKNKDLLLKKDRINKLKRIKKK